MPMKKLFAISGEKNLLKTVRCMVCQMNAENPKEIHDDKHNLKDNLFFLVAELVTSSIQGLYL